MHEVLHRPLYRGEVVYNKTRRRGADGTTTFAPRPGADWLRVDRPDLRIVVGGRVGGRARGASTAIRTHRSRRRAAGASGLRRRDIDSQYLLSGFARCAACGGSVGVLDRRQYGCIAYHKRGTTVCGNAREVADRHARRRRAADLRDALRPTAIMAIVDGVLAAAWRPRRARAMSAAPTELADARSGDRAADEAIAQGGQLPPLLDAFKTRRRAATTSRRRSRRTPRRWTSRGSPRTAIERKVQSAARGLAGRGSRRRR